MRRLIRKKILLNILKAGLVAESAYMLVAPLTASSQFMSGQQSTVYYDADEINLDKETGNLRAKGNAFILFGNIFVSADSFEYNKDKKILLAEGGVRIVRNRERITASRVLINELTSEARMDDVEIYADPKDTETQINEEVLGFSSAELAFEVARQERIREILRELTEIRAAFANLDMQKKKSGAKESHQLQSRYARLLERLVRTRYQPSDVLRNLPEDARKRLEDRREAVRTFATKDPELAKKIAGLQKVPGYLSMKANRVLQNKEQNMDVEKATLTTCRCQPDENPAWGISASRAFVEPNEYITLYGSTLEVGKFPLVYSPWFKMPIKTKRQSGFLLPSFYLSRAGDAASFPYFLTLGDHADSTLTYTYFSKRGSRGEMELRSALSDESRTTLRGEILREKNTTPEQKEEAQNYRWAWAAQSNLPIALRTSLKIDLEKMSDQRYYSDLTKEPGATQDLFTPQTIARRYLQKDAALEHSSEDFSLGVKFQQPQDVFADNGTHVPSRMPRIDLMFYPRTIGNRGFSWEGQSSFENIYEKLENSNIIADGERAGNRTSVRTRINYKVPFNPYTNMRFGAELGHVNYMTKGFTGELNYLQNDFFTEFPFYAPLVLNQFHETNETTLRHNITPFIGLRWIPTVQKSGRYPDIYSTFYTSDNISSTQTLEFGFNTDLQITQEQFILAERPDVQSTQMGSVPASPANEKILFAVIKAQPPATEQESGKILYNLSTQSQGRTAFDDWAKAELNQFIHQINVSTNKHMRRLLLVQPTSWRRTVLSSARPMGLSLQSSFNFEANRTAQQLNENIKPGQIPVSSEPWGDVIGRLNLSAQPYLPLSSTLTRIWQPRWKRYREQTAGVEINSPFGLSVGFVREVKLSEAIDTQGQQSFQEEQLWGVDSTYQIKPWLKFQFQYRNNIKPQPAASHDLEYSSLQKITFLGIQDCLDITLQRFKDRDVYERLATWTLGVNLNFLGQQRQIDSLGKVVDRAIKSQLNKGQKTNLR